MEVAPMGLDALLQALPNGCKIVERAKTEIGFGELLAHVPSWIKLGKRGHSNATWAEADVVWLEVQELIQANPGIKRRNCDLGRNWDILHYLLSANRRGEKYARERTPEEIRLMDIAIKGDEIIADHVRGGQGVHVRFVQPSDVVLIAVVLDGISVSDLTKHFDAEKMTRHKVYKFFADYCTTGSILPVFEAFRRFYLDAAAHEEAAIVCLD
jgi:hypothetical protein